MAKFCSHCGAKLDDEAYVCIKCGVKVANDNTEKIRIEGKSKLAAGLLAIFVGPLGIHNFYLGYNSKGVAQLLLSTVGSCLLVGPFIAWIWALVEAIQIFTGAISVDANGVPLKD